MFHSPCTIQESNCVDWALLSQRCIFNVKKTTKNERIKNNKENLMNAMEDKVKGKK